MNDFETSLACKTWGSHMLTDKELSMFQKTVSFSSSWPQAKTVWPCRWRQYPSKHLHKIQEELNCLSPACFSHLSLPAFNIPTNTMWKIHMTEVIWCNFLYCSFIAFVMYQWISYFEKKTYTFQPWTYEYFLSQLNNPVNILQTILLILALLGDSYGHVQVMEELSAVCHPHNIQKLSDIYTCRSTSCIWISFQTRIEKKNLKANTTPRTY